MNKNNNTSVNNAESMKNHCIVCTNRDADSCNCDCAGYSDLKVLRQEV